MLVALAPIRRLAVAGLLTLALVAPAAAQLLHLDEFIALDAMPPDVSYGNYTMAPGADSSVMVVTGNHSGEISRQRAVAQLVTATGDTPGDPIRFDDGEELSGPRVASDTRGGFIALWRYRFGGRLVARLLDATGTPTTPVFVVANNSFQIDATGFAAGFVVVWNESAAGVRLRRYDMAGQATGPAELVASPSSLSISPLAAVRTSSGGFVIAWDEGGTRVRARSYDASGAPLGEATVLTDLFRMTSLAANPLGGFAIVGQRRPGTHAYPSGVWARHFDESGAPSGPVFLVDRVDPDLTAAPQAAFDPAGHLYVAWGINSFIAVARGRAFDPAGRPLHASFPLMEENGPSLLLAARSDGRFFEAWRSMSDLKMQVRSLCVPPAHTGCGDGVITAPCERCDDGPGNSDGTPDACRTTCALPACGDGVVDHGEQCDDGNLIGCDGCDPDCNAEVGWVCGDGAVSTDCEEQCDDGAGNDDTLPNACRTNCRVAHCGDGVLDDGEGCDDGNLTSCDGCSDLCVPEPGLVCGDGIAELLCDEQCDDGNAIDGDGCTAPCRLERIPGGGSPATDCQVEWVIDNPANDPRYDKHGAISGEQACTDGDPRCDFDTVPGQCTFHLRVCANNTDLPSCSPGERLQSWELRSPSAKKAATRPALAAIRDAFATVPGAIIGPDRHDVCSDTAAVPIAVKTSGSGAKPGKLVLKSYATLYTGEKDSDKLKLTCRP